MKFATYLTIALALFVCASARADILLNYNSAYTQNFDGGGASNLQNTGTSSIVPLGWYFSETGTGADTTYAADNGTLSTANTYSYGATGSTERAFGELTNVPPQSTLGARFTNNTSSTFTNVSISYTGEQWRRGNDNGDKLTFQISTNATSLTTGTWTSVTALDFIQPNTTGGNNTLLNGNLTANQKFLSKMNISLPSAVSPTASFWIRWNSFDLPSKNDSGLAIDGFSLTAVPEPSTTMLVGGLIAALTFYSIRRRRKALTQS